MADEYPGSFEVVSMKYEEGGIHVLTKKEAIVFSVWWLESEVNNGGFHQYFWNSSGDHAALALESLKAVGATYTAGLLSEAVSIAFDGDVPKDQEERQSALEVEEDKKEDELNKLDSKFFEYSEDFPSLINEYLAG